MTALVELDDVWFSHGDTLVLEAVTMAVEAGDFLGVIGPNGSGKTTLVRLMLGLAAPQRGRVRLFGSAPGAFRAWHRVGYVPQKVTFDPALPATVEEVVGTGIQPRLGIFGHRRADVRARVHHALAQVGMEEHGASRIGALSAGQQQRVLIARALVSTPELLILDEPTGGVDPEAQTSFYEILHQLNRDRGVTLVLVSHDIGVVAREVTKLACLNRRLVFHGRPRDFLSEAALAALYGPSMGLVSHEHG